MPYETLFQVVTHGLAERLRSCVPKNISGYVEELWPYETNLEKARAELAQAQVPEGFTVTVPVSSGDLFDEEATVLIKESLAQLGITLTIQKMPLVQKRTLMTKKQVDMAVYDWRPWVPMPATSSTGTGCRTASGTAGAMSIPRRKLWAMRPLPWPLARRNARPNCGGFRKLSMAISA